LVHGSHDAVLVGTADALSFDMQCFPADLADRCAGPTLKVAGDGLFPDIRLVACRLFGSDLLALEIAIRPTLEPAPIQSNRLGKELIAIARDASMSIVPALIGQNRRPPVSSLQVRIPIGRADEHALAWLEHLFAAVTGAVTLLLTGDEGLQDGRLRLAHCVHLGHLNQPLAAQML